MSGKWHSFGIYWRLACAAEGQIRCSVQELLQCPLPSAVAKPVISTHLRSAVLKCWCVSFQENTIRAIARPTCALRELLVCPHLHGARRLVPSLCGDRGAQRGALQLGRLDLHRERSELPPRYRLLK